MANIKIEMYRGIIIKHLGGGGIAGIETLCGCTAGDWDITDGQGLPDCSGCIEIAKNVYKNIKRKELKNL